MLVSAPTRADEAQNTALARSLFDAGVMASDAGDWRAAVERFSRAYALRPTSGIAFNLASAEIEVGKIVHASEHLRAVVQDSTAATELRTRARLRLEEIAPRIAFVTVQVEGAVEDGFELRIDGIALPIQAWGIATPIDPGPHVIDLAREGHVHDTAMIDVQDSQRTSLTLKAQPPPPPVEPPPSVVVAPPDSQQVLAAPRPMQSALAPAQKEAAPRKKRWLVWTSVAVAVAAGTAAAIVLVTRDGDPKAEAPVMGNTDEGVIRW
jgi:hypothetical protein